MMFKRILVAVDGSTTADRALQTAIALGSEQGATLYVLYVVDHTALARAITGRTSIDTDYQAALLTGLRENGRRVLAHAGAAARKRHRIAKPIFVEVLGTSVAHAILWQARKLKVDLIVLGTHGWRGLSRLVLGSVAESVVREAAVPVLLVRSATTYDDHGAALPVTRRPKKRRAVRTTHG